MTSSNLNLKVQILAFYPHSFGVLLLILALYNYFLLLNALTKYICNAEEFKIVSDVKRSDANANAAS
jgi:hypothetical protein